MMVNTSSTKSLLVWLGLRRLLNQWN
jgi:hypothetical protein